MAVTNYITMDGMLMGEMTNGVMRNYGTDALGSVVETVLNGVEENTYQYKPYGGLLAKTGVAADPSFLWNGRSGYRATIVLNTLTYVRARHYSTLDSQWTSVDPIWPRARVYGYARNQPILLIDYTGREPGEVGTGLNPLAVKSCCDTLDFSSASSQCQGSWGSCPKQDSLATSCQTYLNSSKVDCSRALQTIISLAKKCVGFGRGGAYGGSDLWAAATLCCKDPAGWTGCTQCCSTDQINQSQGFSSCYNSCLMVHEGWHQWDCTNQNGSINNSKSETCAYYSQARCMYQQFASRCGFPLPIDLYSNYYAPLGQCAQLASTTGYGCTKS